MKFSNKKRFISQLIFAFSLIFLASCTNNSNQTTEKNENSQIITLEAKSGVLTGTADFGTFTHNTTSTKLVTFTLKNDGSEALVGPATLDQEDQGFSISYSNCPESLAIKKSCILKVVFDPRSLTGGEYSANLNFDSVFVNLFALKRDPEVLGPQVQFLMSGAIIESLDYGTVQKNQNILKTVTIKNISSGTINDVVSKSSPNLYILYDNCSGKNIAKNATCQIKLSVSGTSLNEDLNDSLSFSGTVLPIIALAPTEATVLPSNVISVHNSVLVDSIDAGTISSSGQLIIYFKNNGPGPYTGTGISLDNSNWSIVYNQCSHSLAVNASCQVRIVFSASGKEVGTYSSVLSLGNKEVAIQVVVPPVCSSGYHPEGMTCVSNIRSCLPQPQGVAIGEQHWNGDSYGICMVQSCLEDYLLTNNECLPVGIGNFIDLITFNPSAISLLVTGSGVGATGSGSGAIGSGMTPTGSGNTSSGTGVGFINNNLFGFNPFNDPVVIPLVSTTPASIVGENFGPILGGTTSVSVAKNLLEAESEVYLTTSSGVSSWLVRNYSVMLYDIRPGLDDVEEHSLVSYNNAIYFVGYPAISGFNSKLMRLNSNGTLEQVSNIVPGGSDGLSFRAGSGYDSFIIFNNELYFNANSNMYKINSEDVITRVTTGLSNPRNFKIFNNELYFNANTFGDVFKVNNSGVITKISTATSANFGGGGNLLGVYNNHLYAGLSVNGYKKLVKISSLGEVKVVADLNPGANDMPLVFASYNGFAYVSMFAPGGSNRKLFKINENDEIEQVTNVVNNGSDGVNKMIVYDNSLYISIYGQGWFRMSPLGDIKILTSQYNLETFDPVIIKNELYFNGNNVLYKMNSGSTFLTRLSGAGGIGSPGNGMVYLNGKIYFTANDGTGRKKIHVMEEN